MKSKLVNQILSHIEDGRGVSLFHSYWSRKRLHLSSLIERNQRGILIYKYDHEIIATIRFRVTECDEYKDYINSIFEDVLCDIDGVWRDYSFDTMSELESWLLSLDLIEFNIEYI